MGTTYEKAKLIISKKNINSKKEYYKLCEKDNRLPLEPDEAFKGKFINWIDYLNIKESYYDLETCKNKVNEFLASNPIMNDHFLNLSYICEKLCEWDSNFPPGEFWIDYYNIKNIDEIINNNIKQKKKSLFL